MDKPTPGNVLMNLRYRDERATETRGKGTKRICIAYSSYSAMSKKSMYIVIC